MGLLDGLTDPNTMGLLSAAAGMFDRSNSVGQKYSLGQILSGGLLSGAQGYQGALHNAAKLEEDRQMAEYRKAQMGLLNQKAAGAKSSQDAISQLSAKVAADPAYKPTLADILPIDPEAALKSFGGGTANPAYGLEPKIGINPETGKPGYFIQSKDGATKWLGFGAPDSYKLIPGNDYQPPQKFSPSTGDVSPITPSNPPAFGNPPPPGSPQTQTPVLAEADDPIAPWRNITSPKQRDEMKPRVYEQDNKRLDDLRALVAQGETNMRDLDRFGELNRRTGTGGAVDKLAWVPTMDSDKREMEAIIARLTPAQRVPGSGTTSDKDIGLYLSGLPGIDKPGNVNKAIRDQFSVQLNEARNKLGFSQQYLTERGHLNGVDEARATAKANEGSGGLDVSKLSPEMAAYLRGQDPDAFNRGVQRFQRNSRPAAQPAGAPKAGMVQDGYRFKGGNPADPKSWEKV